MSGSVTYKQLSKPKPVKPVKVPNAKAKAKAKAGNKGDSKEPETKKAKSDEADAEATAALAASSASSSKDNNSKRDTPAPDERKTHNLEIVAAAEDASTEIAGRQTVWLDDVILAIDSVLKHLGDKHKQSNAQCYESFRKALHDSLIFLWRKELEKGGKVLFTWSKARKAIKHDLVRQHAGVLAHLVSVGANASSAEISNAIMEKLDEEDDGANRDQMWMHIPSIH